MRNIDYFGPKTSLKRNQRGLDDKSKCITLGHYDVLVRHDSCVPTRFSCEAYGMNLVCFGLAHLVFIAFWHCRWNHPLFARMIFANATPRRSSASISPLRTRIKRLVRKTMYFSQSTQ